MDLGQSQKSSGVLTKKKKKIKEKIEKYKYTTFPMELNISLTQICL